MSNKHTTIDINKRLYSLDFMRGLIMMLLALLVDKDPSDKFIWLADVI